MSQSIAMRASTTTAIARTGSARRQRWVERRKKGVLGTLWGAATSRGMSALLQIMIGSAAGSGPRATGAGRKHASVSRRLPDLGPARRPTPAVAEPSSGKAAAAQREHCRRSGGRRRRRWGAAAGPRSLRSGRKKPSIGLASSRRRNIPTHGTWQVPLARGWRRRRSGSWSQPWAWRGWRRAPAWRRPDERGWLRSSPSPTCGARQRPGSPRPRQHSRCAQDRHGEGQTPCRTRPQQLAAPRAARRRDQQPWSSRPRPSAECGQPSGRQG